MGVNDYEIRFVAEASAPKAYPLERLKKTQQFDPENSKLDKKIYLNGMSLTRAPLRSKKVSYERYTLGKLVLRNQR